MGKKIKNIAIMEAIESAGYASVNDFCKKEGLSQGSVYDMINMSLTPTDIRGRLRECTVALCEALAATPESLFTEDELFKNPERDLPAYWHHDDVCTLPSDDECYEMEQIHILIDFDRVVSPAIDAMTRNQRMAINLRFGIDSGQPLSFSSIAKTMGITRARAGQLVGVALEKLQRDQEIRSMELN